LGAPMKSFGYNFSIARQPPVAEDVENKCAETTLPLTRHLLDQTEMFLRGRRLKRAPITIAAHHANARPSPAKKARIAERVLFLAKREFRPRA
jgi:hypothetical protein